MPSTVTRQLLAQTHYTSDGVQTAFAFSFEGGYLLPEHVKARHIAVSTGLETPVAVTVSGSSVDIGAPIPLGDLLIIYRDTSILAPLVDFSDSTPHDEASLDTLAKQAVFLAQEARDEAYRLSVYEDLINLSATVATVAASQASAAASANAASVSAVAANASAITAATEVDVVKTADNELKSSLVSIPGAGKVLFGNAGKRLYFNGTNFDFNAMVSIGGNRLSSVGTPTAATDGATKGYVDGVSAARITGKLVDSQYRTVGGTFATYASSPNLTGVTANTGAGSLTVSEAGVFILSAAFECSGTIDANARVIVSVLVNGAPQRYASFVTATANGFVTLSHVAVLAANDVITATLADNTGIGAASVRCNTLTVARVSR